MNLSDFRKHTDWTKVWSGKWSVFTTSLELTLSKMRDE